MKKDRYAIPEIGDKKRQDKKDRYAIPEIGDQIRQYEKDQYAIPIIGARKRKQAGHISRVKYKHTATKRAKIQQTRANRSLRNSNIDHVIKRFQTFSQIGQKLIYICEVCRRIFFKHQIIALKRDRYNRHALIKALPSRMVYDQLPSDGNQIDNPKWLCKTCHENIVKFKIPTLATINKLGLHDQPNELSELNMLERHLIAPAILFMKMIILIKGSQKGIHGQVVCVKSDLNTVSQCLPRLPTDESLIRVKLKRKLEYKGHHMCQDINPARIRQALLWLKDNNSEYDNIEIDFHDLNGMLNDQLIHCNEAIDFENSVNNVELSPIRQLILPSIDKDQNEHDMSEYETEDQERNSSTPTIGFSEYVTSDELHNDLLSDVDMVEEDANTEYNIPSDSADESIVRHDDNNDEQEINDDITNSSAPLYSFLHPVDFAQYAADKHDSTILSLAPGEGNTPEKVLEMEAKCFPVEFPRAENTYTENRGIKISPSRYFNARLFGADNRFARNPEYIFYALYATEVHQIHSNISIAMRIGATKTSDGRQITASMLKNREEVKQIIKRDEGYRFLTQIRGTPAYWEKSKKDLFAMIRQLGVPTFFLTFSAADRRWIEIDNAILIQQGKPPMTTEEHKNMTWEQHCQIIMSNPVTAARMFEYRVQTFIKDVIMSKAKPIGEVEDYYYRTEFQQRGWPHIHMVVWVKDAPKLDEDSDEVVTEFIDKNITCEMPPEDDEELYEIVMHVQMHSKNHTKSCRKTGLVCRFYFPKSPSNYTFICRPNTFNKHIDDDDNDDNDDEVNGTANDKEKRLEALQKRKHEEAEAIDILKTVWDLLSDKDQEFENFDDVLEAANLTQRKLEESLEILSKRKTIYLKRRISDRWVNNYNEHLIRCWNGNMDIQYVLDAYACVMYIVSYITKAEREMGDLLKNAQKEAAEGNVDAVSQLRKLGSVYLQHREVSVMGAIYLTCSMPLKQSTRKVMFIQTDSNGQKISLPLKTLQDNAETTDKVWMPTHIDKYLARPKTEEYKNMCMATFFSTHYQISRTANTADLDEELASENEGEVDGSSNTYNAGRSKHIIKLKGEIGCMKKRVRKPAIIRYPRISAKKDSERYHMNMLRLYLPHQTEQIKPDRYETYQDYHLNGYVTYKGKRMAVREIVRLNMEDFEPKNDNIDEAWDALQEAGNLDDAWAAVAPQNEQDRDDNRVQNIALDSEDDLAEIEIPDLQPRNTPNQSHLARCRIEPRNPLMTEQQAHTMMQQLNNEQRQLFNYVSKWCNEKSRDIGLLPFRIFLTGGAGTGKSHVIKCIQYHAESAFRRMSDVTVDDETVLLVAQTGTAAFNISGQTICSALKIPPKATKDYRPLAEASLNTLRAKYQHLQLLIIDEISMVSTIQLSYIHGRLQQIKGASDTSFFGNVSILAVGDFHQLPPIFPPTPLCFPHEQILKDLWNPLFEIVTLTEIMRQRDDAIFANMLNRLRVRKRKEPLEQADEQLLKSRIVQENVLSPPPDALHLFYLNKDVDNHNETKLQCLDTPKYKVKAVDIDQNGGRVIKRHETPHNTTRKDDTALVPYLTLAVGARAMLIVNIDVTDGLCNGVSGIIKGIEFGNSQNMPKVVYVQFDSQRVGQKARTSQAIPPQYTNCVPIIPKIDTFQLKGKSFTTARQQIPLKLAWAVTIHKVQGQTTEQAVISMKGLKTAMAYVAISRVTHLNGMYLLNYNQRVISCNENVDDEVAKMPTADLSKANSLLSIDNNQHFIIAHHNIQSLHAHIEDLKKNVEMQKAHVICLSETWITNSSQSDNLTIDGYRLEMLNTGKGRGVAMYVQDDIDYTLQPLLCEECDALAIKTYGASNLLIVAVYKPVATSKAAFCKEMSNITAQTELLDTDYTVFVGDFNHNLLKETVLPPLRIYQQLITEPTTANGTLLDHIYITPRPPPSRYEAGVLTSYYSYHEPVFLAIKYNLY